MSDLSDKTKLLLSIAELYYKRPHFYDSVNTPKSLEPIIYTAEQFGVAAIAIQMGADQDEVMEPIFRDSNIPKPLRRTAKVGQKIHRGQERFDDMPYFYHPIGVAAITAEYSPLLLPLGEDVVMKAIQAGFLHDAVEDQSEKYGGEKNLFKIIARICGERTAKIVWGCTKPKISEPSREKRKRLQLDVFLGKCLELIVEDPMTAFCTTVAKLADSLHNAKCIGKEQSREPASKEEGIERVRGTIKKYKDRIRVFRGLNIYFRKNGLGDLTPMIEELDGVIPPKPCSELQAERNAARKAGIPQIEGKGF